MKSIIKLIIAVMFMLWFVPKVSAVISFFWSLVVGFMILLAVRHFLMLTFKPKSSLNEAARAEIDEVMKKHGVSK